MASTGVGEADRKDPLDRVISSGRRNEVRIHLEVEGYIYMDLQRGESINGVGRWMMMFEGRRKVFF